MLTGVLHCFGFIFLIGIEIINITISFYLILNFYQFLEVPLSKTLEELKGTKGKISQKGSGAYTLCGKCNNDTGRWYGNVFAEFVCQGITILHYANYNPTIF
jgi:hypothetical protein